MLCAPNYDDDYDQYHDHEYDLDGNVDGNDNGHHDQMDHNDNGDDQDNDYEDDYDGHGYCNIYFLTFLMTTLAIMTVMMLSRWSSYARTGEGVGGD